MLRGLRAGARSCVDAPVLTCWYGGVRSWMEGGGVAGGMSHPHACRADALSSHSALPLFNLFRACSRLLLPYRSRTDTASAPFIPHLRLLFKQTGNLICLPIIPAELVSTTTAVNACKLLSPSALEAMPVNDNDRNVFPFSTSPAVASLETSITHNLEFVSRPAASYPRAQISAPVSLGANTADLSSAAQLPIQKCEISHAWSRIQAGTVTVTAQSVSHLTISQTMRA